MYVPCGLALEVQGLDVYHVVLNQSCVYAQILGSQARIAGCGFFQTISTRNAGLHLFDLRILNTVCNHDCGHHPSPITHHPWLITNKMLLMLALLAATADCLHMHLLDKTTSVCAASTAPDLNCCSKRGD